MNTIEKLIFEREISALRIAVAFRLLIWGYTAAVEPFQAKSTIEIILQEALLVIGIVISVAALLYFSVVSR